MWEVAQLLRLPLSGPYVVVAAECPTLGKQALPAISAKLRAVDIFSAWRLLPDIQVGIAQVPSSSKRDTMLGLVERLVVKRVGVSPQFHQLTSTAQALRYARVAMNARASKNGGVTVFENSVLAVAAVSAPEVAKSGYATPTGTRRDPRRRRRIDHRPVLPRRRRCAGARRAAPTQPAPHRREPPCGSACF